MVCFVGLLLLLLFWAKKGFKNSLKGRLKENYYSPREISLCNNTFLETNASSPYFCHSSPLQTRLREIVRAPARALWLSLPPGLSFTICRVPAGQLIDWMNFSEATGRAPSLAVLREARTWASLLLECPPSLPPTLKCSQVRDPL